MEGVLYYRTIQNEDVRAEVTWAPPPQSPLSPIVVSWTKDNFFCKKKKQNIFLPSGYTTISYGIFPDPSISNMPIRELKIYHWTFKNRLGATKLYIKLKICQFIRWKRFGATAGRCILVFSILPCHSRTAWSLTKSLTPHLTGAPCWIGVGQNWACSRQRGWSSSSQGQAWFFFLILALFFSKISWITSRD